MNTVGEFDRADSVAALRKLKENTNPDTWHGKSAESVEIKVFENSGGNWDHYLQLMNLATANIMGDNRRENFVLLKRKWAQANFACRSLAMCGMRDAESEKTTNVVHDNCILLTGKNVFDITTEVDDNLKLIENVHATVAPNMKKVFEALGVNTLEELAKLFETPFAAMERYRLVQNKNPTNQDH